MSAFIPAVSHFTFSFRFFSRHAVLTLTLVFKGYHRAVRMFQFMELSYLFLRRNIFEVWMFASPSIDLSAQRAAANSLAGPGATGFPQAKMAWKVKQNMELNNPLGNQVQSRVVVFSDSDTASIISKQNSSWRASTPGAPGLPQWDCLVWDPFTWLVFVVTISATWDSPRGGTCSIDDRGVRRSFMLQTQENTWASNFTPKKHPASNFSTPKNITPSTSILNYSIKQTSRP